MPVAVADSVRIDYEVRGRGVPALLFNHSGASRLAWRETFLEALAETLTVVTLDYRGTGQSAPAAAPFSLADLAADGRTVLRHAGIDGRVVVIGASMGGAVAQEFALAFPSLVSHLVLMGTFAGSRHRTPPDASVTRHFEEAGKQTLPVERMRSLLPTVYAPAFLARHEALALDLELKGSRCNTDETLTRHGAATAEFDAYDRLPAIDVPTLVIHGTEDPIMPLENGRTLAGRIQGARFIAMPGIGHLPGVEAPVQTADDILAFVGAPRRR